MSEQTKVVQPGEKWTVNDRGANFYVVAATGALSVTAGEHTETMEAGDSIEGRDIGTRWIVENLEAVAQSVTVSVSDFIIRRGRLSGAVESTETPAAACQPSLLTVTTGGVTLAAITDQRRVTIKCQAANTGQVTIGTVAGEGLTYGPGEGQILDAAYDVPLIASAGTQYVEVLQES